MDDCLNASKTALINYQAFFDANYCKGLEELVPEDLASNAKVVNGDTLLTIGLSEQLSETKYVDLCWRKKIGDFEIAFQ